MPFGVAGLGERRRLAGTSSRSPPSSTYVPSPTTGRYPAPLDPHYSPSRSSTTKTQRMCHGIVAGACAGLAGRGCVRRLPGEHMSRFCFCKNNKKTIIIEGDLLEVPAKQRRSPRPANPNAAVPSAPPTAEGNARQQPTSIYSLSCQSWSSHGLGNS